MALYTPLLVILAAVPMLCGQVRPDGPFGPRVVDPGAHAAWYRATRIAGAGFLIGGAVWFAAAMFLPPLFDSTEQAQETVAFIGATAVSAAIFVSMALVESGKA